MNQAVLEGEMTCYYVACSQVATHEQLLVGTDPEEGKDELCWMLVCPEHREHDAVALIPGEPFKLHK